MNEFFASQKQCLNFMNYIVIQYADKCAIFSIIIVLFFLEGEKIGILL